MSNFTFRTLSTYLPMVDTTGPTTPRPMPSNAAPIVTSLAAPRNASPALLGALR